MNNYFISITKMPATRQ